MKAKRLGLAMALMLGLGGAAEADPVFEPGATEACVATAVAAAPSLSGYGVLDCVGKSAQACMETDGGDTTFGMGVCLEGEWKLWDKRLNQAYTKRLKEAKKTDAEMQSIKATVQSMEDALRQMQRAWITFRDGACLYEVSKWQGGTGSGPAGMACMMQETARQALILEGWWSQ
jgi:uncharacterized protein YecT (DUF1311 family)